MALTTRTPARSLAAPITCDAADACLDPLINFFQRHEGTGVFLSSLGEMASFGTARQFARSDKQPTNTVVLVETYPECLNTKFSQIHKCFFLVIFTDVHLLHSPFSSKVFGRTWACC